MYEMIELVNNILPKDKPRYLMGVEPHQYTGSDCTRSRYV